MRVLHVYNNHRGFGGSDKALASTIAALRQGGVEVHEFVRDSRDLPAGMAGKLRAAAGGVYAAEAVRGFRALLARQRFDLVHVHELYPLISPWVMPAATRAGVPVVMAAYDFRLSCPVATHHTRQAACFRCLGGREHWAVLRNCRDNAAESVAYALRNASARWFGLYERHVRRYVVVSEFQRDFFGQRIGVPARRLAVNPCVVAAPERGVDDPAAGGYIGFAGRFVHEKGVEVMVQACRSAGLPMGFAGSAPGHPAVRPDDRAFFVMTKSPAELAAFYRGARLIVVPSIWSETFGLVAAEAMAHGVPVVVSDIGALPGTVGHGAGGVIVPPGDAAALAATLRRLWDDTAELRRLGAAARAWVLREYSESAHFERLLAVYREVQAEHAAGAPV